MSVIVSVAGYRISIVVDDQLSKLENRLPWLFDGFVVDGGAADLELRVGRLTPQPPPEDADSILEEVGARWTGHSGHWNNLTPDDIAFSHLNGLRRYCSDRRVQEILAALISRDPSIDTFLPLTNGCLALSGATGRLLIDPEATENPMQGIADGSFATLALTLPGGDALMVHGAGIVHQERSYLFLGLSGGGKSTVAELAKPDSLVLSDDAVPLLVGETCQLAASPFTQTLREHHETAPPAAPLAAIIFLNKSTMTRLRPINRTVACARLFQNHVHYLHLMPQDRRRHIFDLCLQVSIRTPSFELDFRRDRAFMRLLNEIE